jgi:hypothetical protein
LVEIIALLLCVTQQILIAGSETLLLLFCHLGGDTAVGRRFGLISISVKQKKLIARALPSRSFFSLPACNLPVMCSLLSLSQVHEADEPPRIVKVANERDAVLAAIASVFQCA